MVLTTPRGCSHVYIRHEDLGIGTDLCKLLDQARNSRIQEPPLDAPHFSDHFGQSLLCRIPFIDDVEHHYLHTLRLRDDAGDGLPIPDREERLLIPNIPVGEVNGNDKAEPDSRRVWEGGLEMRYLARRSREEAMSSVWMVCIRRSELGISPPPSSYPVVTLRGSDPLVKEFHLFLPTPSADNAEDRVEQLTNKSRHAPQPT